MKKIALFVLASVVFCTSCMTPKVVVKCDSPNSIPAEARTKIVVAPVLFTERSLAILPIIDAGIYNAGVAKTKSEQLEIEKAAGVTATAAYVKAIADKSGKPTVASEAVPETVAFDMFSKVESADYPKKIAAETGADVVVVVLSRVRTTGIVSYGFSGFNLLDSTMYVFDKDGKPCGAATFSSIPVKSGSTKMPVYKQICDENLVQGSKIVDLLF